MSKRKKYPRKPITAPVDETMGRPLRLEQDPTLAQKIVNSVKTGNYVETAAALYGVSKKLLYEWLKAANRPRAKKVYVEFRDAIEKAIAFSEARDIGGIDQHGHGRPAEIRTVPDIDPATGQQRRDSAGRLLDKQLHVPAIEADWKAIAWRAERRYGKRWVRRQQIQITEAEEDEGFAPESSHTELMDLIEGKDREAAGKEKK